MSVFVKLFYLKRMTLEQAMALLGKNVKKIRKLRGFTQEEMRDRGFNYRYYQKIEAGQINATLDTLVKLAKTFKCSLADLLK